MHMLDATKPLAPPSGSSSLLIASQLLTKLVAAELALQVAYHWTQEIIYLIDNIVMASTDVITGLG